MVEWREEEPRITRMRTNRELNMDGQDGQDKKRLTAPIRNFVFFVRFVAIFFLLPQASSEALF